ncbi:MAG: TolC family protein [Pseudomonadota bacterium]
MFFIPTQQQQQSNIYKKAITKKNVSFLLISNLLFAPSLLMAEQISPIINVLSLEQVQIIALKNEPGITSQQLQAQALVERSIADGQLMDPKLQVGLNNIPTDSFSFDQENMTQFKIGIIQQFPSGNSLAIKKQKTLKQSELFSSKIANRKLTITKQVRLNYFEIYYWEQAKKTLIKNKKLFSQLVEIVQSLFSVGRNNQQDLIRAQLELSRLDDRISKITQKINSQRSKLSRWIGVQNSQKPLSKNLPELKAFSDLDLSKLDKEFSSLEQLFINHPKILEIDKQLEIKKKDIELSRESYKPGWGLNVSYGYRDNNPNGNKRADFISAGITMDLPFFTAKRQDKKLLAKELQYGALKDQRIQLLRQLVSELQQQRDIEEQLQNRHQLYKNIILPQANQQTLAALLAYQSDRGDFADVMRAYIDDLNAHLDERRIAVDHLQTKAKILYFLSSVQNEH